MGVQIIKTYWVLKKSRGLDKKLSSVDNKRFGVVGSKRK